MPPFDLAGLPGCSPLSLPALVELDIGGVVDVALACHLVIDTQYLAFWASNRCSNCFGGGIRTVAAEVSLFVAAFATIIFDIVVQLLLAAD